MRIGDVIIFCVECDIMILYFAPWDDVMDIRLFLGELTHVISCHMNKAWPFCVLTKGEYKDTLEEDKYTGYVLDYSQFSNKNGNETRLNSFLNTKQVSKIVHLLPSEEKQKPSFAAVGLNDHLSDRVV